MDAERQEQDNTTKKFARRNIQKARPNIKSKSAKPKERISLDVEDFQRLQKKSTFWGFNPLNGRFQRGEAEAYYPIYGGDRRALANWIFADKRYKSEDCFYFQYSIPLERLKDVLEFVKTYSQKSRAENSSTGCPAKPGQFKVVAHRQAAVPVTLKGTGYLWCFTNCSGSVRGLVCSIGKCAELRSRTAQLLGWEGVLSGLFGTKFSELIDLYSWQYLLFHEAWKSLMAKLDTKRELTLYCQQFWRSHVANLQLHIAKLLSIAVYIMERSAYRNNVSNIQKNRVKVIMENIEGVLEEIPLFVTLNDIRSDVDRDRYRLWKQADTEGFSPYRYFLGHHQDAPGTGKTAHNGSKSNNK